MSSKKFLKMIAASLLLLTGLHFMGCATEEGKSDDDTGSAMAADLDKNPDDTGNAATAPSADNLNPDLAKDTLSDPAAPVAKDDDLGIDDVAPPAEVVKPKETLDTPPPETLADPQKLSENDINAAPKTVTPEINATPANPFEQNVEVTAVKYNSDMNGGTLVIETSGPATFRKREGSAEGQVVIEIANTKIPAKFLRPLITKDFKQSIASVYVYEDKSSSTARFVVQMRDRSVASVQQDGRTIMVASQGGSNHLAGPDGGIQTFDTTRAGTPKKSQSYDEASLRFYGKPINIEVRDTPVIDVLNFISEQSGANLLISNEVKGQITLKLKQVPWDQALLLVMKTQQLGYVREGTVLRIAPLDSLTAESDKAAKVVESQRNAEPLKVQVIPVSYAKVEDLVLQLEKFLSKRGKAVADKRTSSLVLTDIVENLERAAKLVKALDTPPFQVLIEGKVVEASQTFSRNLGVQWGLNGGSIANGKQTLSPNLNITPTSGLPSTGANLSLTYGTFDALGSLTAQLNLYESEQLIHVVSSPRIVTVNNETANIAQSLQIPVQQSTVTGGAQTTSYTFVNVDLSLKVTPQITAESDVLMQIDLKREFLANAPVGLIPPSISKREAQTKVMVRNGQTAVIGGIYQADNTVDEQGVPYLRNLPVVGWLFKNQNRNDNKNELLLFLTPRILNSEQANEGKETL